MSSGEDIVAYLDDDETQPVTRGQLNQAAWSGDADALEYLSVLAEAGDDASMHSLRMLNATVQAANSGFDAADIVPTQAVREPEPPPEPKDYGSDLYGAIDDHFSTAPE